MANLVPLHDIASEMIEILLDAAFGSDRHQRSAYLLRIGSQPIAALSFALTLNNKAIACIQCWPVALGATRLVLVGPVAVHPDHQSKGYGSQLMRHMIIAAHAMDDPPMVMIGDAEYYGRFGFSADATAGWEMPGPWQRHRLLSRNPAGHPLPDSGMLERADAL